MRNNCHCADYRMITHANRAKDFRACSNVYIRSNPWDSSVTQSKRNLLQNKAVGANFGIWMDDDAVRMRNH